MGKLLDSQNINSNLVVMGAILESDVMAGETKKGGKWCFVNCKNVYKEQNVEKPFVLYFKAKSFNPKVVDQIKDLKKGSTCVFQGRLALDSYTTKDGRTIKDKALDVVDVKVLANKPKEPATAEQVATDGFSFDNDDLPF